MSHEELFYLLALQKTDGIGDALAKKLLVAFGSAEAVFKASIRDLTTSGRIPRAAAANIRSQKSFGAARDELNYILKHNIAVLQFQKPGYPDRLNHCPDAPLLLFSSGTIDLSNPRMIGIVGTRNMTAHGADFTRQFISDLAPLNPVIVSGFAYGIDIVAHQAAVEHGLQTLAIIGSGLARVYPASHKKHVEPICRNGGFLSEFWSNTEPEKENFVKRNRIVAGICEATVVIESAERGGSLITAQFAADYNREVFAVPGRPSDVYSAGCNTLIKTQKAQALTSAADLVYLLNWQLESSVGKPVQKQLFVELDELEQTLYDFLRKRGPEQLDIIALECRIPISKLSSALLQMELKGVIRTLPGKQFESI